MNQSFKQVFVTNSGSLLTSGTTTDLAVGQISFFDGDNYVATTTPTYFKNKSLIVGWGYPDVNNALMGGTFSENEKTKKIGGRKIKAVRTKRATHPTSEIVVAGWSGDIADTNTLSVKPGEKKALFLRLTGTPIDRLYSTQGFIRRYVVEGDCVDPCNTNCTAASDPRVLANNLVNQINSDPKVRGLVKASVLTQCTPTISSTTSNVYLFTVSVSDDGTDSALGYVQTQYPGVSVSRVGRIGITSTYQVSKLVNTAPGSVSNAGLTIIPDCPTCPSGYTLVASGYVYEIKREDNGPDVSSTIITDYTVGGVVPTVTKIGSSQLGNGTYIAITASAIVLPTILTDQSKLVGQTNNSCVITSATTTAWALFDTLVQYQQAYTITIADSVCGTNRLADLQAAYPSLTIAVVNAGGSCVHSYSTNVLSQVVRSGCSLDLLTFVDPQSFQGVSWIPSVLTAIPNGTVCLTGIKLEAAWVDRITNDCTYGYWPYEADSVHIEFSEYDHNYNGDPTKCKLNSTVVKRIQNFVYAKGVGSYVRQLEEKSKEYFLKYYSFQPILREIEGFSFQADPTKYYDEIEIDYSYDYPVGQFSERYVDNYTLTIFVQEGLGGNIVKAINNYITSPEINLDAVTL